MADEGVTTGLKLWLFFLLSFVLLGYSVPLSLCLGAIGGLAGGWIVAWWHAKPGKATKATPEAQPNSQEGAFQRVRDQWRRWRETKRSGLFRPSRSVYKRRRSPRQ